MQVAANPFSQHLQHSHYHSYYQIPPPGPQDHELKRQYLALLQPHQVIDICLACDAHVSPYAKSSIWPPDLAAAIATLQNPSEPQPDARPTAELPRDAPPIMNSLRSPAQPEAPPSIAGPSTEPQPPDREAAPPTESAATPAPAPAPEEPTPTPPQSTETAPQPSSSESTEAPASVPPADPAAPATAAGTAAAAAPTPPQPAAHPQYPGAYAYGHPQAAYPHAPYYAGGYSYPYGSYPAYHAQPPPAAYPAPPQAMYPSMVPVQQQQQQQGPQHDAAAADDLPSYEEMIVEALTGCGDPEGWVPKDLFAWMAARYPLQSNFRPSASQALNKAFKRGRFEKGSNGKYRLNATWNGGNTSRRTTRRPQTQTSQAAPSNAPPAPPFTTTPRVHQLHPPSGSATPNQATYQSTPFGYSYGYPGYPAQEPQASTSTAAGTAEAAATAAAAADGAADTDTDAAYKAAQDILSAINFSDLYQTATEDAPAADAPGDAGAGGGDGVEELLSHVQAMLASAQAGGGAGTGVQPPLPAAPTPEDGADPRAALQAQLALLAAQLAELAKIEEAADLAQQQPPQQQQQQQDQQQHLGSIAMPGPIPAPMAIFAPPPPPTAPVIASLPIHAPTPITPAGSAVAPPEPEPEPAPEPMPQEEEEESDDDDMEEVI